MWTCTCNYMFISEMHLLERKNFALIKPEFNVIWMSFYNYKAIDVLLPRIVFSLYWLTIDVAPFFSLFLQNTICLKHCGTFTNILSTIFYINVEFPTFKDLMNNSVIYVLFPHLFFMILWWNFYLLVLLIIPLICNLYI